MAASGNTNSDVASLIATLQLLERQGTGARTTAVPSETVNSVCAGVELDSAAPNVPLPVIEPSEDDIKWATDHGQEATFHRLASLPGSVSGKAIGKAIFAPEIPSGVYYQLPEVLEEMNGTRRAPAEKILLCGNYDVVSTSYPTWSE